jgi:hypothetical protein
MTEARVYGVAGGVVDPTAPRMPRRARLLDRLLETSPTRARRVAETVLASGFVLAVLFVMMAARPYNHDDEWYVTAGVLARHLTLYRDFAYHQPPFHPLVLSAVFRFLDGHYYLAGRLFSLALALGVAVLGWFITTRIAGSSRLGLVAALLFATSTTIQSAVGCVRNDILSCALMLGTVAAVLCGSGARTRRSLVGWMVAAGVLASLGFSSKQTYVFVPAGTLLYLLLVAQLPNRGTAVLAFVAGGAAGALLDVYYLLVAGESFVYQLFQLNLVVLHDWYTRAGYPDDLTLGGRLYAAGRSFVRDGVAPAALVCAIASLGTARAAGARFRPGRTLSTPTGYLTVLFLLSVPCAFAPNPSHPQYFVPTFALGTLIAVSLLGLHPPSSVPGRAVMAVLLAAGMVVGTGRALSFVPNAVSRSSWVAMQIHADGLAIRAGAGGAPICVATLSPLRPLDAGLSIVPELASGPFVFRAGDAIDRVRLERIHGTSPSLLPDLLDRRRPGAILLGFENDWNILPDAPLRDYARAQGFRPGPPVGEVWYADGPGIGCVR